MHNVHIKTKIKTKTKAETIERLKKSNSVSWLINVRVSTEILTERILRKQTCETLT